MKLALLFAAIVLLHFGCAKATQTEADATVEDAIDAADATDVALADEATAVDAADAVSASDAATLTD
jgi:PBP1b-binding outer membrane lipoprotein LpoB